MDIRQAKQMIKDHHFINFKKWDRFSQYTRGKLDIEKINTKKCYIWAIISYLI